MPDIKYVCLSDLHLGAEDGLLTNLKKASRETDPLSPSPVMVKLVDCLRLLIHKNETPEKPVLILSGDILELALSTLNEAAMFFERFMELAMPPGDELFSEIIYIPGNHDHHQWEDARETQYVNFIDQIPPGSLLDLPWHTTKMFYNEGQTLVPAYFLTNLVQRMEHLKKFVIHTAYPNYGLYDAGHEKCVIFTHGHYIEPIYHLMTFLKSLIFPDQKPPMEIWEIEGENFAWIDFFWSTMGRSGEMGKDIEMIYEKIQDPDQLKKLLHSLAQNIAHKYELIPLPLLGDMLESVLLENFFDFIANKISKLERSQTQGPLSETAAKGLRTYMENPVRTQIHADLGIDMPRDVTFVFGHTHKPFEADMNFEYFPQWAGVYNTGGWVIDGAIPQPFIGGAIVLVDENLNAASLRMYNDVENPKDYQVQVKEASHQGAEVSAFFTRMVNLVNASEDIFKLFFDTVSQAVIIRRKNIRDRIGAE